MTIGLLIRKLILSIICVILIYYFVLTLKRFLAYKKKHNNRSKYKFVIRRIKNFHRTLTIHSILIVILISLIYSDFYGVISQYMEEKRIDKQVETFLAEDDEYDPKLYALTANVSQEKSEDEVIAELMNDLHFDFFLSTFPSGEITVEMIDSYETSIKKVLIPPTSNSYIAKGNLLNISAPNQSFIMLSTGADNTNYGNNDSDVILQKAREAEDKAKEAAHKDNPDCVETLTFASTSIMYFQDCLGYSALKDETTPDIYMRIGVLYYACYIELEYLDKINPNYRTHLLLCAFQCFENATNCIQISDDFWLKTDFYYGECCLQVGNMMHDPVDIYNIGKNHIEKVLADPSNEKIVSTTLYEAAIKDYKTYVTLTE